MTADQKDYQTYAALAEPIIEKPGGRYAALTTASPSGPLPVSSWAIDPVPIEPPLGFRVDDVPSAQDYGFPAEAAKEYRQ